MHFFSVKKLELLMSFKLILLSLHMVCTAQMHLFVVEQFQQFFKSSTKIPELKLKVLNESSLIVTFWSGGVNDNSFIIELYK